MKKQFINYNTELLAPAGDLEKLKYALIYGADAVFVGGLNFSLRARASNFTIEDIKNAAEFAHSLGKKVYVTTNIIPHDSDLESLDNYLKQLEETKIDAIIAASISIVTRALEITNLEVHLSTQQSVINSNTIKFWKNLGVTRIVLGRELSLDEINLLNRHNMQLEVFIHGGMCMSYSGRCSISNTTTKRDANRGGCAHSCRWDYRLFDDDKLVLDNTLSLSSKDLNAISSIPSMIDMKIDSLKIEGRMKSLHYIATITKTYRLVIDEYLNTGKIKDFDIYYDMITKAENRETSQGYLDGFIDTSKQIYDISNTKPQQSFVGLIRSKSNSNIYEVEQRNNFKVGEMIEVFQPNNDNIVFKLEQLYNDKFEAIDVARHAKEIVYMIIPYDIEEYSILRKVL